MMIYFTGDIHGAVDGIADFVNKIHPTMEDVIVLLGDVGANYYKGRRDNLVKSFLNYAGTVFLCVHGNHEMRSHEHSRLHRNKNGTTGKRGCSRSIRI